METLLEALHWHPHKPLQAVVERLVACLGQQQDTNLIINQFTLLRLLGLVLLANISRCTHFIDHSVNLGGIYVPLIL